MRSIDILAAMAIASCTTPTKTAPESEPKQEPTEEGCRPPKCYPDPKPPMPPTSRKVFV